MSGETVDLLARRQARLEANGAARRFEWGDEVFEGPPELPLAFVELLRTGEFVQALRTIFGDSTDAFMATVKPTAGDLMTIAQVYGASLPSSSASTGT